MQGETSSSDLQKVQSKDVAIPITTARHDVILVISKGEDPFRATYTCPGADRTLMWIRRLSGVLVCSCVCDQELPRYA